MLKVSYPLQKTWGKFSFPFHSYFPSILHSAIWEKWRERQRGRESNLLIFSSHFLLPGFPLCLFATYYFNPLLTSCSSRLPQFFFLISTHKAKPEHQGEPCVQLTLCGLSAVTRDHLESITQTNMATRHDMYIGTKRVQTCDLNCHNFFLKVRFILTPLDKTKRPRMSHLCSYPRQTPENN